VLVYGDQPGAEYDEPFDCVSFENTAVLVGRRGTDDERTLLGADARFSTTIVCADQGGFEVRQRPLREAGPLAEHPVAPVSVGWLAGKKPTAYETAVLACVVRPSGGAHHTVRLECYFADAPCGVQPAITVTCRAEGAWGFVYGEINLTSYQKRARKLDLEKKIGMVGFRLLASMCPAKSRDVRLGRGRTAASSHDVGPREMTVSASRMCLLLAICACSPRVEYIAPGAQSRSSALLDAFTRRIFGDTELRLSTAPSQRSLWIKDGMVNLDRLRGNDDCTGLLRRTGIIGPTRR
jgi:hypothetical protein